MKKILATLFCVSLLGMPILAHGGDMEKSPSCCATQVAENKPQCCQEDTAKKDCCATKQTAQKADCCATEKVTKKACASCAETAQTWMTPPATCKDGCKASS